MIGVNSHTDKKIKSKMNKIIRQIKSKSFLDEWEEVKRKKIYSPKITKIKGDIIKRIRGNRMTKKDIKKLHEMAIRLFDMPIYIAMR